MLFIVYGNNTDKRVEKARSLLSTMEKKRPDAQVVELNEDSASVGILAQGVSSQGLFEQKNIYLLSHTFENIDVKTFIEKNIETLHKSENAFILNEEKLAKKILDQAKEFEIKTYEFDNPFSKVSANKEFNTFSLTDLLTSSEKQKLWVKYNEGLAQGVSAEEIHGVFVWQLKSLLISHNYSQTESGLKPFVYNKCTQAHKNWDKQKTEEKYFELLKIYNESRLGNLELPLALEKFILEI